MRLYRAITRSRLDYGSIVYGSARPSYLKCLNTVYYQDLRLSLGAFRTSPVESLYVLAREPSLTLRRIKLSMQYIVKLAACPSNPAYQMVFRPQLTHFYESRPNTIQPLGLRMKLYLDSAKIDTSMIAEIETSPIPIWIFKNPFVDMELTKYKKSETNPLDYQERFNNIKNKYPTHKFLYTDGSKDGSRTAYAVTSQHRNYCNERIPDESSIYSAELMAIYMATKIAIESDHNKHVICSDSKSALQAIENKHVQNPLVLDIFMVLHMSKRHEEIIYCWVPSHVDIEGNEKADLYAKKALQFDITDYCIPYTDFRPIINDFILSCWQLQWNACENNRLRQIMSNIRYNPYFQTNSRRDQIVLHRCLIGHSRLTHVHLLLNKSAPICERCQSPLTVKHILIECNNLQRQPFQVTSLKQLLTNTPLELLFGYLHNCGLYYEL